MADDSDACLPTVLTDFVFDLCDSVTQSQIAEEQSKLYNVTFRELSSKYYAASSWPSPQAIASEANGHPLFLAIYREVTHRHLHSVSRPNVRDRIEGWNVYRELFDEVLDDDNIKASRPTFFILPDWAFDILHEFVYQFQGFCQFKAAVYATALKHKIPVDGDAPSNAPHHLVENMNALSQNKDAWSSDQVMGYLTKLIRVGKESKVPGYQYLGIFATIALSRLECLLGDYRGCLQAVSGVMNGEISVSQEGEVVRSSEIVHKVFPARLSYAYHAGVAYMMLRRYKDATRTLGDICSSVQSGLKTGYLRKLPNSDQFSKTHDRMIALLAILSHVCPPVGLLEDSILRTIRDNHGSLLNKIDAGEKEYDELFAYASPKFISPVVGGDNCKLQMTLFRKEMASQQKCRKLRSYLKLYTSLEVKKLAAFTDSTEEEMIAFLLSYKHRMNQLEEGSDTPKSALDIHYHISTTTVQVDEPEKQRRFENYFMQQIAQNAEICKDVTKINTKV